MVPTQSAPAAGCNRQHFAIDRHSRWIVDPWFPMDRSLGEARELPLDEDALGLFLGGTARRLLDRTAG